MRRLGMGVLMVAVLQACGNPTAPSPRLTLVIEPNPVAGVPVPVPCPTPCTSFPVGASWTLTVTSNVDGRLEGADVAVLRLGTQVASRPYRTADFIRDQGTDRVSAGGALAVRQGLQYPAPIPNPGGDIVEVSVRFLPDSGAPMEQVVRSA